MLLWDNPAAQHPTNCKKKKKTLEKNKQYVETKMDTIISRELQKRIFLIPNHKLHWCELNS